MHSLHFTLVLIAHASVAGADATTAVQPLAPVLHDLGVIAKDDAACLNDPTQGVNNFPQAQVHHYYSSTPNVTGAWSTSGMAVNYTSIPGQFDAWSVFTPGAIYDKDADGGGGRWFLWYGAVANGERPTRESIGVVTASSPFGPWTRSPHNPVFVGNETAWCGPGKSARVDEANAYVVGGRKFVMVKGVCTNFTALPTAWVSSEGGSFDPPYVPLEGADPMQHADATPSHGGFEQFGLATMEPTPVFVGVPGDEGGVPTHFIQFNDGDDDSDQKGKLAIHLLSVEWANATVAL
eukprot:gene12785-5339_t